MSGARKIRFVVGGDEFVSVSMKFGLHDRVHAHCRKVGSLLGVFALEAITEGLNRLEGTPSPTARHTIRERLISYCKRCGTTRSAFGRRVIEEKLDREEVKDAG